MQSVNLLKRMHIYNLILAYNLCQLIDEPTHVFASHQQLRSHRDRTSVSNLIRPGSSPLTLVYKGSGFTTAPQRLYHARLV